MGHQAFRGYRRGVSQYNDVHVNSVRPKTPRPGRQWHGEHTTNSTKHESLPHAIKQFLLIAAIWSMLLYGCESWTVTKNTQSRFECSKTLPTFSGMRNITQARHGQDTGKEADIGLGTVKSRHSLRFNRLSKRNYENGILIAANDNET